VGPLRRLKVAGERPPAPRPNNNGLATRPHIGGATPCIKDRPGPGLGQLQYHTSSGYTTNRGTYVQPYVATNPNSTQRDNFSATGNVNPYTGAVGTRNPRY